MDYKAAASRLGSWDDILILTHRRPDGDTIGCAVGLCALLRQVGKTAWVLPNPEATARLAPYLEGYTAPEGFAAQRLVAVDVATPKLLTQEGQRLLERRGIDLAIDHHVTHEDFARENCVEADKAACGEIIFRLVEELGTLTREVAEPLYLAVSTDTGCFVYSNTSPNTHRVAAALMEAGAPYREINKIQFRTRSLKRLRLESELLRDMDVYEGGRVAIAALSREAMDQIGATEYDAEDIAAFLGQIEGVGAAATIRELEGGECKVSLRSSGGYLDASAACALLGGGGHREAAGCSVMDATVAQAKAAVLDAILRTLHG